MKFIKLFDFLKSEKKSTTVQTGSVSLHPFESWFSYTPLSTPDGRLYDAMREAVPIIDAALDKIIRLTGGFQVICSDPTKQKMLDDFAENVPVGASSRSLRQFVSIYLDSLLTYGNAVGEIVLDAGGRNILALYNADLKDIHLKPSKNQLDTEIYVKDDNFDYNRTV